MLQLLERILSELLRRLVGAVVYLVAVVAVLWFAITYTLPRMQTNLQQLGTTMFRVRAVAPQQVPPAMYRQ